MTTQSTTVCPFCDILAGAGPGTVIARNDEKRFALIKSIHPESVIHWLAIPFEHMESTEAYEGAHSGRFIELFEWAVTQTKQLVGSEPQLERGFTLKTHFGSYETVPHPKIHILAME